MTMAKKDLHFTPVVFHDIFLEDLFLSNHSKWSSPSNPHTGMIVGNPDPGQNVISTLEL
jgi:hypothetical protein